MNQQVVEYLRQNKDQYEKEVLVAQLRQAGHSQGSINEAVEQVYGQKAPTSPEIPVKYAGFWVRFAAVMIDGIVLIPIQIIIGILLVSTPVGENSFISAPITLLITGVYYVTMTHLYQATLGKKAMGIKVRSVNQGNASLGQILVRETIGKLISMFILYIGYIMAAFTGKKQALHDMMAKTVVIYKDPNKKNNVVVIMIVVSIIVLIVGGLFASIVLVSLNSAREKAKDASFKATASSILPAAILCCDPYGGVKKSLNMRPGGNICNPKDSGYPSIYPVDIAGITVKSDCDSGGNFMLYIESLPKKGNSCIGATLTQESIAFDDCY